MRVHKTAELAVVKSSNGSSGSMSWHKASMKFRFTDGGALHLSSNVIKEMNYATVLRMSMPTVLYPEKRQGVSEAIIVGHASRALAERQNIRFARSQRILVGIGNTLVLRLLHARNVSEDESETWLDPVRLPGGVRSYSMYLPRIAELHNRLVETRKRLPIGPQLVVDTHDRQIISRGKVISAEPSIVKVLCALAVSPGHFASHDSLVEATGVPTEHAVQQATQRARRLLEDNRLSEYGVESVRGEGYRLVVPYASLSQEVILANDSLNP